MVLEVLSAAVSTTEDEWLSSGTDQLKLFIQMVLPSPLEADLESRVLCKEWLPFHPPFMMR